MPYKLFFTLCYILVDVKEEEMTVTSAISSAVPEDLLRFTTKQTNGL